MLVSIITPVTGDPVLQQAVQSVQDQDYDFIEHIIIIDGKEREDSAHKILKNINFKKTTHILCLPYPTGKNGYKGHRIYGMSGYLANGDYLIFLDQDNWLEKFHVSSLVDLVCEQELDWAYSLRNLVDEKGEFITRDDCQSLGKWVAFDNKIHHIDTNCYFLKKKIAVSFSPIWFSKGREGGLMSPDMQLANEVVKYFPNYDTTGCYTVNYRVGSTEISGQPSYFIEGNTIMEKIYPEGFPWQKYLSSLDLKRTLKQELNLRDINFLAFPNWNQEESKIHATLDYLSNAVLLHREQNKITLLLYCESENQETATSILWDFFAEFLDNDLSEATTAEVVLVTKTNPVRWKYLLETIDGYISVEGEDKSTISRTIEAKISELDLKSFFAADRAEKKSY